jgi:pimeloyl-ACP methyl ester carboxylesterase
VVRLDLPGYGLTGPAPDGDYRIAAYLRVLGAFLDSVGVTRASFAGNSLGGEIAWRWALAHPERTDRLVLVDPAGYPPPEVPSFFGLFQAPVLGDVLPLVGPRWLYAQNLRQVYAVDARITDDVVDRYWELSRRRGNRKAFLSRAVLRDPFPFDSLRALAAPTLVQWGGQDPWIPPFMADSFAVRIPGVRLRVYPDAGHVPMEEIPDVTGRDARAFLLGRAPVSAVQAKCDSTPTVATCTATVSRTSRP